ncbi:hypothetical protein Bbelb_150080 [Branchiostoma belcheri]|nr:hypothetical protein Bbelb_150080 [Branchiostoma belcheri]
MRFSPAMQHPTARKNSHDVSSPGNSSHYACSRRPRSYVKLTNLEQKLMRRYVPNESVAQKRFQADQEALRSIPTEAPGWVYNQTAADMFRNKTISSRFGNGNFMVTQENTPVNSTLKTYFRKPKTIKVDSKNIFRFLKESPFKNKRFKTCSVVGNGGILKGSGCGEEIDAAEFVFSYLFIEAFLYELSSRRAFLAQKVLWESHAENTVIYPHPDFVRSTHSYWQKCGVKAPRASTGLLLVTVATQICDEVRLYGFWPFHSDRNNTRLTEHYYDNALPSNSHKISDEFKELQRLHNTEVTDLSVNLCSLYAIPQGLRLKVTAALRIIEHRAVRMKPLHVLCLVLILSTVAGYPNLSWERNDEVELLERSEGEEDIEQGDEEEDYEEFDDEDKVESLERSEEDEDVEEEDYEEFDDENEVERSDEVGNVEEGDEEEDYEELYDEDESKIVDEVHKNVEFWKSSGAKKKGLETRKEEHGSGEDGKIGKTRITIDLLDTLQVKEKFSKRGMASPFDENVNVATEALVKI